MRKTFWEVIYDDEKLTMDVMGPFVDDARFTENVSEMQRVGMKTHCQTADVSIPKDEVTIRGYTRENKLYSRLLLDYEIKTRKHLRRW